MKKILMMLLMATSVQASSLRVLLIDGTGPTTGIGHSVLDELGWVQSGHTGTPNRLSVFNSGGYADEAALGTGLTWDGNTINATQTDMYMFFEIPLNPGGFPGYWTDFELKIEAVDRTTPDAQNLVYYWQSMGDPWDGNNTDYGDTDARCYFIDSHQEAPPRSLNPRKWQLYTNTTPGVVDASSMYAQYNHPDSTVQVIQFYPSREGCYVDWTTWQAYTNSHNLRASWIRYDPVGPETNSIGGQVWHPVDIQWKPARLNESP